MIRIMTNIMGQSPQGGDVKFQSHI